jgi:hypothetical protein
MESATRGSERIIKRFAIIPIYADKEYRWLEWCYIKQCWKEPIYDDCHWANIAFVTEDEYDNFIYNLYED